MTALNHTPLHPSLLPKPKPEMVSISPEAEPVVLKQKIQERAGQEEKNPVEEAKEEETKAGPVGQYVEKRPEDIELPPELQKMGLKAVTQTDFPDYQNVQLPISDEKVLVGSKAPLSSSMRWLAEFAKFLLWKAHIALKTVHGRVVRVIKR